MWIMLHVLILRAEWWRRIFFSSYVIRSESLRPQRTCFPFAGLEMFLLFPLSTRAGRLLFPPSLRDHAAYFVTDDELFRLLLRLLPPPFGSEAPIFASKWREDLPFSLGQSNLYFPFSSFSLAVSGDGPFRDCDLRIQTSPFSFSRRVNPVPRFSPYLSSSLAT